MIGRPLLCFFFFFNDTATTEIYTLSLHDALPIYQGNRSVHQWVKLNPNEVNIFENGFLAEFKLAQQNLAINRQTETEIRLQTTDCPDNLRCRFLLLFFFKQKTAYEITR